MLQRQVEELEDSLMQALSEKEKWEESAAALHLERGALEGKVEGLRAALSALLRETASVRNVLAEEAASLGVLLEDAAADKRALQAELEGYVLESSSLLLKLQVLWDDKEALGIMAMWFVYRHSHSHTPSLSSSCAVVRGSLPSSSIFRISYYVLRVPFCTCDLRGR